jgi:N-acyl-D-amino-acid deacylase
MDEVLAGADAYLSQGGRLSWDRYPYLAGCTVLSAVLPAWTFSEGTQALIRNLSDPAYRDRIRAEFNKGLEVWNNRSISVGWDKIYVSGVTQEKNRWMEGKHCAELASACGQDPIDFVCELLAEEELAVTMISFYGSDKVMDKVLSHPNATVGSDGVFLGRPHPRLYGTFPRYLQLYVREKGTMTLAEAVRKITSSPAEILGLKDRGLLREGFWADVVLLDPTRVADRATYEDPKQYPAGIPFVFVNGQPVVEHGQYTGGLLGQVLRNR